MGEVRENHSESPAHERQLLDVLGPVSEEACQRFEQLTAIESAAAVLCEASIVATAAYKSSCKYDKNRPGVINSFDARLRDEKDRADMQWQAARGQIPYAKSLLADVLLTEPGLRDFKRAAVIQALFRAEPEERAAYAERFERALDHLARVFQQGCVVFIRPGRNEAGYYRVIESGIKTEIRDERVQADAPSIYRVIVRSKQLVGSKVLPDGATGFLKLQDVERPEEVELYGLVGTVDPVPEPLEILEGKANLEYDPRGPRYVTGDALSNPVAQEASLARATALALAAQRQDIVIDLLALQNERVKAELTGQIIRTMSRLVMSQAVVEPKRYSRFKDIWLNDETGGQAVAGVEVDLTNENRRRIGDCICWLGLDRTQIEEGVTTAIDSLEKAIADNRKEAKHTPEVDTGRRNKRRFFRDVFGG